MSARPRLSVLIVAIPSRLEKLAPLIRELETQATRSGSEVLALVDNRSQTTGEKRNALVRAARGEYVAFVDDDDTVGSNYLSEITAALKTAELSPDVVVFDVWVDDKAAGGRVCRYDVFYENEDREGDFRRFPNHLMVWRREIVRSVAFPALSHGEGDVWATRVQKRYRHLRQHRIRGSLYTYHFDRERARLRAAAEATKKGVGGREVMGERGAPRVGVTP